MKRRMTVLVSALTVFCMMVSVFVVPAGAKKPETPEERAAELLSSMTLEEKVGQMILAYKSNSNGLSEVKQYKFGGYVLFAEFYENRTPAMALGEVETWQSASDIPMLIAVDEEGGTINRASKFAEYRRVGCASPQVLYANGGWNRIKMDTAERAVFLHNLGVNCNLVPVADVPYHTTDYMYPRAFGTNAGDTAKYVRLVTEGYNAMNIVSSLKHFPGYGSNGNTHNEIIRDSREKKSFTTRDLVPFQMGINAGSPMVMVSHNIVEAFDPDSPASISAPVHEYLRKKMGFEGVIVTDGLEMKGVKNFVGDLGEVGVRAVEAGNDLLCTGNSVTHYKAVLNAVKTGRISEERIDESVLRILTMKVQYGLDNS